MLLHLFLVVFTISASVAHVQLLSRILPGLHLNTEESSDSKICTCYHKSGTSIPDALHTDLTRVAVYFYRDGNNKLKVYTPNKEKQLILPDFGIEKGDIFTSVSQDSPYYQLLNSNFAVDVKRNSVSDSKEELHGSVQSHFPFLDVHADGLPLIPKLDINLNPRLNESISLNLEHGRPNLNTNLDVSLPVLPHLEVNTNLEAGNGLHVSHSHDVHGKSNVEPAGILSSLKGAHLNLFGGKIESETDQVKVTSPKEKVRISASGLLSTGQESEKTELERDSDVSVNQALVDLYSKPYDYVTFDKWLYHQMQRIQKTGQTPVKNVDLISLKWRIEKILRENKIYVSKKGLMVDAKGLPVNVANLKLRPILIGDTVAYESVFTDKNGVKYEFPSNLQYLEAILVTTVDPSKILGIIPLGKTYVPRMAYRKNAVHWDPTVSRMVDMKVSECKTGNCPLLSYDVRRGYPKSSRLQRNRNEKGLKAQGSNLGPPPRFPKKEEKAYTAEELQQLLKVLMSVGKPQDPQTKTGYEYDAYEEGSNEEEIDIEEDPLFRIIGGNAATSSGTPVSSRGRTAYQYLG